MLAVGTVVIPLLIGGRMVVPHWAAWEEERVQQAVAVASNLATVSAARRALPQLRDSLRARHDRKLRADTAAIHAPSAAVGAVEAASVLSDVADDTGVTLSAQQVVPDTSTAPGVRRVSVRVSASTDVRAFAAFLRAIAEDEHPLLVRELSLSQADPGGPSEFAVVRFELLVDALCLVEPPRRRP